MNMKRRFALMLAAVMCIGMLAGCSKKADPPASPGDGGGSADEGPIKIGYLGPLTGDVAQYGIAVQNGMKMYIDEINEKGGVLGRQVEIVSYDEKGDAVEAMSAFNRLVTQDGVVAILGSVTSGPTIAVAQEAAGMSNPIPMITASGTADEITSYGDNMFRSCFLDPFQGETMARYAGDILEAKTAAVIYNSSTDYSVGLRDSFTAKCQEIGIEVVATEAYSQGDVDFRAQLTNIHAKNPDVILVPDYYNNADLIAQQVRGMGSEAALLGCDGWDGILNVTADASSLTGCYFSNHYASDDPEPMVANFLSGYKAVYGEDPMSFAATAYDAAMILCDAIERAGSTDSEAIIAAMKTTDMACVTGQITFDEKNNPIKTCAIITIDNAAYKLDRQY